MKAHRPEIFVLGGPNGAGKTTVAARLFSSDFAARHFVNADVIAQSLPPGEISALRAGREMLLRLIVHILYLGLASPELAIGRVRLRVERSGHDIPAPVILRRYYRSLVNLFRLYLPLADTWTVYDKSGALETDT